MTGLVIGVPLVLLAASAAVAYLTVRLERRSGDRLRSRRTEQPLAHELPYWTFLDDGGAAVAVNIDLTYSSFIELSGVETDCLDNEALNGIALNLHGVLQQVPAGAVLQGLHWTDGDVSDLVERYRAQAGGACGIGRLLIENKADHLLRHRGLRRSHLILAVSAPNKVQRPAARALGFVKKFPSLTPADHAESLRGLRTLRDQVTRGLQAAGVTCRPLDVATVRRIVYQFLNPRRAHLVPELAGWADLQTAREQLVFAGVKEARDHLVVDGHLVRVVTLKSLPTATEPALLEALLVGLPFHCRVHFAFEALDSAKAIEDLKRRRDQAHLLATLREKRNQEAEAQEQDVADLIDKNLHSSVRMARIALSVVLSVDETVADARLVLERQAAEVLRLTSSLHGAQAMVDELCQLDEWLATLPGNASHGRRFRQCTSENAAHLLPAWQAWAGAGTPSLLLQDGRGHLLGLDPFAGELDNPNAFMAGASGSGKSTTTNYLLLNLLAAGAKALVVDVGGSYRRIIDLLGGQYFAVQADGDCALNPFFSRADIVTAEGRLDERRLQFILAVVECMVCDGTRKELRNTERAVLTQAIAAAYAATAKPVLSDLAAALRSLEAADPEDREIARALARDLRVWIEGPAGRLVNRPSTIRLTTDVAAFDLKGLEAQPHLQAVVMLILSGIIWNLVMRDATERKVVVFDEVWRLLSAPASARLVEELYRTSRKYRCSILTISQAVEDFTSSSIAPALTNNSATVYLLRHRRGHEGIADQFRLNARELELFRGLEMRRGEYTEALVLHGEHHFLARVALTSLEYWIATTHPPDLRAEQELAAAHPGLPRLELLQRLATRYPQGAGGLS